MKRISFIFFLVFSLSAVFADNRQGWIESRTEHFVFVYRADDAEAVRQLCGFCEDVYKKISAYFNYYPKEVRCVVLGDVDIANGSYGAPPHHLELYVRSPTAPWLGARTSSWLMLLLTHELTHYFDLASDTGFFYTLSLLFGEGVRSGEVAFDPAWLVEGITVSLETELTTGGRGRNQFFLMYAKALLLDDVPFTLGHLEYYSAYPPPSRYYLFGYLFLDYLKRHYGLDVYRKIHQRFLDLPLFGPWAAIRAVTGIHQDALWADMRKELKDKFKAESAGTQGESFSPAGIGDYYSPQIAENGIFLYRVGVDQGPALVVRDPVKKAETVLVETQLTDERSWTISRDGKLMVYAALEFNGTSLSRLNALSDLYLVALAGGEARPVSIGQQRRLTVGRHLWHPALSPDGTRLVAVQGAGSYSRLVSVDPRSGETAVLFEEADTDVYNPQFSPDGKLIVFTLNRRGMQDIYILKTDLSVSAAQPTAMEARPTAMDGLVVDFLPSMAKSTYPASFGEPREPGLSRAEPREMAEARPLFGNDFAGDYFPRFIDNDTVLFTSDREGALALYTASVDGKKLTRVLEDRIAAFDGIPFSGGILYGTYRSTGYCLKVTARENLVSVSIPLPATGETPLPPLSRLDIASRPYLDPPQFQFWIPDANIISLNNVWHAAFGVYVYCPSLLGTMFCDFSLLLYPDLLQPEASLRFALEAGPFDLEYSFVHDYSSFQSGTDTVYQERFSNRITLALPLLDRFSHLYADYFAISAGLNHVYLLQHGASFPFLNNFSPAAILHGNVLAVTGGILFEHYKSRAPAAFFPPWSLIETLDVYAPLPLFAETSSGVIIVERFSFSLPGLWPLSSFKLGLKASYASEALLGAPSVVPRGFFSFAAQTEVCRLLVSLDYQTTIAYTDAPLFGGLHLDGLGAGLHAEMFADFNPMTGTFSPDRFVYTGLELVIKAGIGQLSLPIGVGASLRFDTTGTYSFDFSRDFAIYIFFSFDSFFYALDNTLSSPRPMIR
jgi:hypothetical protein